MIKRVSKDRYYLKIASEVAKRSTCIRSMYGAVIVKDDSIKATGYNGSCRGAINCCDVGKCNREGAKTRTGFENCLAVHAEENAASFCSPEDKKGATIYISAFGVKTGKYIKKLGRECLPCYRCYRILVNSGISHVCVMGANGYVLNYPIAELSFVDPLSFGDI